MGLFTNLFFSKRPEQPSGRHDVLMLASSARFELEITSEERHQTALEAICAPRRPQGVNRFESVSLILEDRNRQVQVPSALKFTEDQSAI